MEYLTIFRPYKLRELTVKAKSEKESSNFDEAEAKNWDDALNKYAKLLKQVPRLLIRQRHKPDNRKNARAKQLYQTNYMFSMGLFYVEICSFKRTEYFRIKNHEDLEHRAT